MNKTKQIFICNAPQDLLSFKVVLRSLAASLLVSLWLASAASLACRALRQGRFFLGRSFWKKNKLKQPYMIQKKKKKKKKPDKDTLPSAFALLGRAPLHVATGFPD